MAKKKHTDETEIDNDLDFDDLSDMDDEFGDVSFDDEGMSDDPREPNFTEVATELAGEAGSGFLEDLIKTTAKKSLPDSYHESYYDVMDYKDLIQDEFSKSKEKLSKSFASLAKEAKKVLPFRIKMVDNFLDKFTEDYESYKAESEEQQRNSMIESNLSSLFDKQLEITSKLEAKHDAEENVRDRREIVSNKISTEILTDIATNTSNATAFTLQIAKEYYRKSLELQFKTFFIQTDLLKTTKDSFKAFSQQFDSIVKNTGLPDYVKLKNAERLGDVVRKQISTDLYKKVFNENSYISNVKQKFSKYVGEKVSNITDNMDNVTSSLSMLNMAKESGDNNILTRIAAGMAGSLLGEKAGEKVAEKIKGYTDKSDKIKTGGNILKTLSEYPSTFFQYLRDKNKKFQENNQNDDSITGTVLNKLSEGFDDISYITSNEKVKPEVNNKSNILDFNSPAIFDNLAYKSLTDVIPMYLAKILKENTDLRSSYQTVNKNKLQNRPNTEELVYNYGKRKLTTIGDFKNDIEKDTLKTDTERKVTNLSSTVYSDFIKNNKDKKYNKLKNDKNKQKLETYMKTARKKLGADFSLESTILNYKDNEELKSIVTKDSQLEKLLDSMKEIYESKGEKDKTYINERYEMQFSDSLSTYPVKQVIKVIQEISRLASPITKSKTLNTLTLDESLSLCKMLTNYYIYLNKDITYDNIISLEFLTYLPKEKLEDKTFTDKLKLFISDVKFITESENQVMETSLLVLLGMLNKALKSNIPLSPDVFEKLNMYNPQLFKGHLSGDNLVDGKLNPFDKDEKLDRSEIRTVFRLKNKEANELQAESDSNKTDPIINSFMDKMKHIVFGTTNAVTEATQYADKIKESIKGKKPDEVAKILLGEARKASDKITGKTKEMYDKISAKADTLITDLNKIIDDKQELVKEGIKTTLQNYIKLIDDAIAVEKERHNNTMETMSKLTTELNQTLTTTEGRTDNQLENNKKFETKMHETKIKMLEKIRVNCSDIISTVNSTETVNLQTVKELITKLSTTIKTEISNFSKTNTPQT